MSLIAIKYRFDGFELDVTNRTLKYDDSYIDLPPKRFDVLSFLVEKSGITLSKEEMLSGIWPDTFVEESNIGVHVANIRKVFRDKCAEIEFIETVRGGRGYRFLRDVIREEVLIEPQIRAVGSSGSSTTEKRRSGLFSDHPVFILITSLFYGMLFWVVLLLEVAYQFDVYGPSALWRGFSLSAWTGLTAFFGLFWMEERTRSRKKHPLLTGFAFLFFGGIAACLAMWRFVPLFPITAAESATQAAFLAFCKNCLLYILPLAVVFLLLPYQTVIARRYGTRELISQLRPVHLFVASVFLAIVSHIVTLDFADTLLESDYRVLFLFLVIVRFLLYFGLALAASFWFYLRHNDEQIDQRPVIPERAPIAWKLGTILTLVLAGSIMFLSATPSGKTPILHSIEVLDVKDISATHRTLRIRVTGERLQPARVFVRVAGEGCPLVSPCVVENDVLEIESATGDRSIEGVPLTLKKGEFLISVQNGDSHPSNSLTLVVD